MTPRDNCYISGYEGPNEILQPVPDREWTMLVVVNVLDPNDEIRSRGGPYKFAIQNSPEIGHLGKTLISPN